MGLLKTLKDKITKNKQPEKKGMPYKYQAVTWNQGARRMGVGKDRNKIIQRIEGGSPKKTIPYNKHIVNALREKMNMPLWDETGGKSQPDQDFLAQWDPSLIAYDQTKVRRK